MVLSVSSKTIKAQQLAALEIGAIEEVSGYGQISRDKDYKAVVAFNLQANDEAKTEQGRLGLRFADDSKVKLTEHSTLIIDEYIYDPNPTKSKLALSFAKGTARFVTAKFSTIPKENMTIRTDSATVAIRGTDFTITVEPDTGESLFILLPDEFGNPSGEISVTTAMGEVILNQAYQATTTTTLEATPSPPVILDLSLEFIDNMLIVTPPKKAVRIEEKETQELKDPILDFNDLDFDYLAEENLKEEEQLDFTELDYDALNVNFLEDLLNILNELDSLADDDQLDQSATSSTVQGTNIGQDTKTQITTVVSGAQISLNRTVGQGAVLNIDSDNSYTVILEQDGIMNEVKVNGGSDSTINIRQGSG